MSQTITEPIYNFGLSKHDRAKNLFSKIGVVGCGKEGHNIVTITASAGVDVVFVEPTDNDIQSAFDRIERTLNTKITNWGLTATEKKGVLSRIKGTTSYDELADCDFVIECIRYNDDTGIRSTKERREVFKELERVLSPTALIASNASTVIISELSAELEYKERCLGIHFLVSQPDASIIEAVRGVYTSDETFDKFSLFASAIKHEVIEVRETFGLVSLRLFYVILNDACQMLMEGVATVENIDKILSKGWGYRMGVFRSADIIGIEKIVSLMEDMFNEYGDMKFKPSPVLMRLFRAKQFGIRTLRGFYVYDENWNIIGTNF